MSEPYVVLEMPERWPWEKSMSEKRIVVPREMLHAAMKPFGWHPDRYLAHTGAFFEGVSVSDILEAALRWLAENPIVPTEEQIRQIKSDLRYREGVDFDTRKLVSEWQHRMFLAPEPEVPAEIKEFLWGDGVIPMPFVDDATKKLHNSLIIELHRRNQKANQ